jgi:hypothetical protein
MKQTVRQKLESLQRIKPHIDAGNMRYLYARPADLKKKGKHVVVYSILWSNDARLAFHKTTFSFPTALSVPGAAVNLNERIYKVFREAVIPSMNIRTDTSWGLKLIVGWHYVADRNDRGV